MNNIGTYITIFTVIISAYLTYNNRLKLTAFELFLDRRKEVLKNIESYLVRLYSIQEEIQNKTENKKTLKKYSKEFFHEGLILYHKIKSANFGEPVDVLNETFWSIITEKTFSSNKNSIEEISSWIQRTINTISALYGFAYSSVNEEIELLTFPIYKRLIKRAKKRFSKKKIKNVKKKF